MIDHKYKIGQFVNYKQGSGPGAGVYQIAQLMPPAGDEPQYRIKSETSLTRCGSSASRCRTASMTNSPRSW